MPSNKVEDCSVQVSTLLSHGVSPWARTREFVNPAGVDPETVRKKLLRARREAAT